MTRPARTGKDRLPPAVYVLGLAIFAMGTSEFMLAGLLPGMAADLGVSVPDAGLLISAFAAGMVVGAPLLALATLRLPRRATLLGFLAVFALAHVAGALAPGYGVLFGTRIVGAFVYAGFFGVAAVTAAGAVTHAMRGRALAVVTAGLTLSTVLGVPAGTLIGQYADWRAAFWTVAALSAVALVGIRAAVPSGRARAGEAAPRVRDELRTMARPRLWLAYGTVALSFSSMMATFSYLGALLTDTTGLPERWVPAVLALYGLGTLIGIAIGGRFADAHPYATLRAGMAGVVAASAGVAVFAGSPAAVIALVPLLGAAGMATNPAANLLVFAQAGEARTLAGASITSAFNVGNSLAPWLGGLAIGAGFGYPSAAWVGAGMAAAAIGTVLLAQFLDRRGRDGAAETAGQVRAPA